MPNVNPQTSLDKICLRCNREFTGVIAVCPHDNAALFARGHDPLIGTTLDGKYILIEVIGRGAMGVVYQAQDTNIDRRVAIKILLAEHLTDSVNVKRFRHEGKAASRLNHPNVITTYDFGITSAGQPYIVMDYLQGSSLEDLIEKEGNVAVDRAIKIMVQACDALEHAHKHGVIHRDIKPSNIVLIKFEEQSDFVKVVDFGVAKLIGGNQDGQRLTQVGEVCGSPIYMSPEQCIGADLDCRSDIYSLAVVLYETLTGNLPLCGRTMVDTMTKHQKEIPPAFNVVRPDLFIPERLESIVFKALAKNPDDRQQSMEELMVELQGAIPKAQRSELLRTVSSPQAVQIINHGGSSKASKFVAIAAAVLLAVLVIGGIALSSLKQGKQAPSRAQPGASISPLSPAAKPAEAAAPDRTSTVGPSASKDLSTPSQTPAAAIKASTANQHAEAATASLKTQAAAKHSVQISKPPHPWQRKTATAAPRKPPASPPVSSDDPFSDLRSKHSSNH